MFDGDHVGPGHHDLARGGGRELEDARDELLFRLVEDARLCPLGDDELQLLGAVMSSLAFEGRSQGGG